MKYDVMIIGAGPGGYTAANKASENGLKVILFEKDKIGGTCLNRGCIPMKALIEASHIYHNHLNNELYGIKANDISFDYELINKRKDEIVKTLRDGVKKSLNKNKVDIINGQARIVSPNKIECNNEIYEGDNIIIASGSITSLPPIKGIELCLTSDDILEKEFKLPKELIIIGGGVIGVEIADCLNTFGTKITIIELADRLIPTLDKDLGTRLQMFFKKRNIEINLNCGVKEIKEENNKKIVSYLNKNNELVEISSDEVVICTGRKANIDGLLNDDLQIEINRGIVGDQVGKTNYENIFVIGDSKANNIQLAHVAEAQGENIIDYILNKELTNDISVIPSGIYTSPEIASVGESEDNLKAKGIEYKSHKYLTGANGKCLIENSESGFVKVLSVDDIIVGGQIVAPHATELIGELTIAVQKKMSLKEFGEVVHPHPTISEMMWHVVK